MSDVVLIIIIIGLAIILAVLAYNIHQEKKYQRQVREQFGHADKDALLHSKTDFVRDGGAKKGLKGMPFAHKKAVEAEVREEEKNADLFTVGDEDEFHKDVMVSVQENEKEAVIEQEEAAAEAEFEFKKMASPVLSQTKVDGKRTLLLDLEGLPKVELPWFDPRFDYMAYIALSEPQELHNIPRLSSRHRFQIAGCTRDERFQIAEPIPGVAYQGFVIGLQAISRSGLATVQELERFGEQANQFAKDMNGSLLLTDIDAFLKVARPLDDLCARVDQTIAMHLVSRTNVSGLELRSAIEELNFELGVDGAFHYPKDGEPLFSIITLDNSPFTSSLLSSQAYRGFSMLFDIPHVPAGEKQFNDFMDLAVKLASKLSLDLVNDKLEELSTEWLVEVRRYVLARQDEMKKVGIEPSGQLAQRLFS